jgi:hypothetical protein
VQTRGFNNAQLRTHLATLLGENPEHYSAGRMSYDLRRLRLHGLIQRIANTHRYQLTAQGLKVAMFFSRTYVLALCLSDRRSFRLFCDAKRVVSWIGSPGIAMLEGEAKR